MNASPIAYRELLVAARKRGTYAMRLGAGFIAGGTVGFVLLSQVPFGRFADGAWLFDLLIWLTAVVTALAGLLLTADSISSERREGTLGLLFLTDLSGFDVVSGKLLSSGLNAAGVLLTVLPVMGVTLLLGGVTAGEYWRGAIGLVNLLWVALNAGLAASTRSIGGARALVGAAEWALLLFIAIPLLAVNVPAWRSWPYAGEFIGVSPVWTLLCAQDRAFTMRPDEYWHSLLISHLVGWLFLLFAAWRVPRIWRSSGAEAPTRRDSRRSRCRRLVNLLNPVASLNRPGRWETGLAWGIAVAVVSFTLTSVATDLLEFLGPISWLWGLQAPRAGWFALELMFTWKCCAFFGRLRDGGGELLLTVPVTELQVLGGGWAGARKLVQGPGALLAACSLITPWLPQYRPSMDGSVDSLSSLILGLYLIATAVADFVALAWLSARFGLRSKSPIHAFALSLAVLFVPCWVLFCVPSLLIAILVMAWGRNGIANSVRGWITGDFLPPPQSRAEAQRQGRIVPETM